MRRWERRLKDLALALEACCLSYFDPERFRFNANSFLVISRTVSFLFQKDKASIDDFEVWHKANVVDPWRDDIVMKWSVISRNTIEKQGDLDLYSEVAATLIFSYLEEEDLKIALDKKGDLGANVKRLVRLARTKLPSGISDVAVVRIERRWIANTLPDYELLHALRYIYSRMYEACGSLAKHLCLRLQEAIPEPTSFDEMVVGSRMTRYLPLNSKVGRTVAVREYVFDRRIEAPMWVRILRDQRVSTPPTSYRELLEFHECMAYQNFMAYGNHLAMLWLYVEKFTPIDYIATAPIDQAEKFIFWRTVADRVHYLRARFVIWVAEAWLRQLPKNHWPATPVRNLPITGEVLQLVGLDGANRPTLVSWEIKREAHGSQPTLLAPTRVVEDGDVRHNYLMPVRRALRKVHLAS